MVRLFKRDEWSEKDLRERAVFDPAVPISKTFIAPYQRGLDERWVEHLARHFNRDKAAVVYLSKRDDGRYAIIDGQHRIAALRKVEGADATVPAWVYSYLGVSDEADRYLAYNRDRHKPSIFDEFKAELLEGDDDALGISSIVGANGMIIKNGPNKNGVQGISALRFVYRQYGPDMLDDVLSILHDSFGDAPGAIRASHIRGLAAFVYRYPDADRNRVVSKLSALGPEGLDAKVLQFQSFAAKTSKEFSVGQVILGIYNSGLRSNGAILAPWQTKVITPAGMAKRNASPLVQAARAKSIKAARQAQRASR